MRVLVCCVTSKNRAKKEVIVKTWIVFSQGRIASEPAITKLTSVFVQSTNIGRHKCGNLVCLKLRPLNVVDLERLFFSVGECPARLFSVYVLPCLFHNTTAGKHTHEFFATNKMLLEKRHEKRHKSGAFMRVQPSTLPHLLALFQVYGRREDSTQEDAPVHL